MLYMLVRITKPKRVLEVGSLCGYSTRWILSALSRNGHGLLITFDINDAAEGIITEHREFWKFIKKDIFTASKAELFDNDIIFIDALHRNSFAQKYTREILAHVSRTTPVVIHDIYNPMMTRVYAKKCAITYKGYDAKLFHEERDCIKDATDIWFEENHDDSYYGPSMPTGEGVDLMSWLARIARVDSSIIKFNPHNAPDFTLTVRDAYIDKKILKKQSAKNYNPAAFFVLKGV